MVYVPKTPDRAIAIAKKDGEVIPGSTMTVNVDRFGLVDAYDHNLILAWQSIETLMVMAGLITLRLVWADEPTTPVQYDCPACGKTGEVDQGVLAFIGGRPAIGCPACHG